MSRLVDQFRGCMVGGLVGDCLGAVFEMQYESLVPVKKIDDYFDRLKDPHHAETYQYTDDTAMARQIAASFIHHKTFVYKDLAEKFSQEYFREPWRGYGGSVVDVFNKLKAQRYEQPFKPAAEQFNGSGSYGNGAGMRAHPVGLACYRSDLAETMETALNVGRLTHSHVHGLGGGLLQTLAVKHALYEENVDKILKAVREGIEKFERKYENTDYSSKLDLIQQYCSSEDETDLEEICFELGNSVAAVDSVPTAFFCFLRCCKQFEKKEQFEQTIRLAIRLGGDTDTIASMAGAISGAYLGLQELPEFMIHHCESVEDAVKYATKIHSIVTENGAGDANKDVKETEQNGSEVPAKKIKIDE